MDRAAIEALIAANHRELRAFGVREMYLFGSAARESATGTSDVDVLVDFETETPTFRQHMGLLLFLEDLLGTKVDLATRRMITPEFARGIAEDLVRVA